MSFSDTESEIVITEWPVIESCEAAQARCADEEPVLTETRHFRGNTLIITEHRICGMWLVPTGKSRSYELQH